jgi:hypothetical protein
MTIKTKAVEPTGHAADHLAHLTFDQSRLVARIDELCGNEPGPRSKRMNEDRLMQPARRQAAVSSTLILSL